MSDENSQYPKKSSIRIESAIGSSFDGLIKDIERQSALNREMMLSYSSSNLIADTILQSQKSFAESLKNSSRFAIDFKPLTFEIPNYGAQLAEALSISTQNYTNLIENSLSSVNRLRYDLTQMSDLMRSALTPPSGAELFINSTSSDIHSIFRHSSSSAFTAFQNKNKLYENVFDKFQDLTELDTKSIIIESAAYSYQGALTKLEQQNEPPIEPIEIGETESQEVVSLEGARVAAFATIVPPETPEQMVHAYMYLWNLEHHLRVFIVNVMSVSIGPDWEKKSLPPGMHDGWKDKQAKAVKAGASTETSLIQYSDFTDYLPLITNKKNWVFFKDFFRNEELTKASFQRLFPYRLDTMHGRTIPKDELVIIAGDCQFLMRNLSKANKN